MVRTACTWPARGKPLSATFNLFFDHTTSTNTTHSDGNIRYYEYENDKFEFLSEYKSADPQRGLAFVPRRAVNVRSPYTQSILIACD